MMRKLVSIIKELDKQIEGIDAQLVELKTLINSTEKQCTDNLADIEVLEIWKTQFVEISFARKMLKAAISQ